MNGSISPGKWIQVEENSIYKSTEGVLLNFTEQGYLELGKLFLIEDPFQNGIY